jgi:hypothetical protein
MFNRAIFVDFRTIPGLPAIQAEMFGQISNFSDNNVTSVVTLLQPRGNRENVSQHLPAA